MHKNPVWLGFLGLIFAVTCYFIVTASLEVYHFQRLEAEAPAQVQRWSIEEIASSQYCPKAHYSYTVNGQLLSGEMVFSFLVFQNPKATQQEIRSLSAKEWTVSYDPNMPEDSMLEKKFPIWSCLRGGLMFCIFVYFVWLGFYVGRKTTIPPAE